MLTVSQLDEVGNLTNGRVLCLCAHNLFAARLTFITALTSRAHERRRITLRSITRPRLEGESAFALSSSLPCPLASILSVLSVYVLFLVVCVRVYFVHVYMSVNGACSVSVCVLFLSYVHTA